MKSEEKRIPQTQQKEAALESRSGGGSGGILSDPRKPPPCGPAKPQQTDGKAQLSKMVWRLFFAVD
jgi:hypothetical protein